VYEDVGAAKFGEDLDTHEFNIESGLRRIASKTGRPIKIYLPMKLWQHTSLSQRARQTCDL
jgi:hypothetical protein